MSEKVEHSGRMVGGRSSVDVQTVWYVLVCPVCNKKKCLLFDYFVKVDYKYFISN